MKETYDEKGNVCDNQDDFNIALKKGIRYTEKETMKEVRPLVYVYLLLWFIFITWACLLALKVTDPVQRTVHLVLAIMASPIYIIASYLGGMKM